MKVLFVTNIPSPYRVDFFNELGKNCDLTVCFERHSASDRDEQWKGNKAAYFREVYADVKPIGIDKSIGLGIAEIIKKEQFDHLVISGYASPAVMCAIAYCRLCGIPYYIESDGGLFRKDKFGKKLLKKFLLCKAKAHFTTCDEHISYLKALGISPKNIYKYPFTSLNDEDIISKPLDEAEKLKIRKEIGIVEKYMVLSVGQFIPRKGFDLLLEAARGFSKDIGVYIAGGKPTQEYIEYKEKNKLENVHFIDFMTKEKLKKWYLAADCFVLPTREDIWGLVINEAMAVGLPVVTTNRCIAGVELITDEALGRIIPTEDSKAIRSAVEDVLHKTNDETRKAVITKISEYTFKAMAKRHMDVWEGR